MRVYLSENLYKYPSTILDVEGKKEGCAREIV